MEAPARIPDIPLALPTTVPRYGCHGLTVHQAGRRGPSGSPRPAARPGTAVCLAPLEDAGDAIALAGHGIEVAAPFLDNEVIRACLAVPAEQRGVPGHYKPLSLPKSGCGSWRPLLPGGR
ncbi:asparagine synthase-related protein [Streptomyces lydicus]|uniref:asparagine synthase-related protein n=1 Tax=Streptomyces lydicus TaxID=47763 RepID=UPI00378949A2